MDGESQACSGQQFPKKNLYCWSVSSTQRVVWSCLSEESVPRPKKPLVDVAELPWSILSIQPSLSFIVMVLPNWNHLILMRLRFFHQSFERIWTGMPEYRISSTRGLAARDQIWRAGSHFTLKGCEKLNPSMLTCKNKSFFSFEIESV